MIFDGIYIQSQARPNYTGINQDEVLVPSSNSIDVSFLLDQLR